MLKFAEIDEEALVATGGIDKEIATWIPE